MPERFLVKLRSEGRLTALVCVLCDLAGREMPKHVEADRPVLALKHQGDSGLRIQLTTVEAIAERYLRELRAAVPEGPVILCGYSFGGVLAFEMAIRLEQAGMQPPLLILIDSYAPSLHAEAMRQGRSVFSAIKHSLIAPVVERRLRKGLPLQGAFNHYHIIDTYDKATLAYQPVAYNGRMTVLHAADGWGPPDMGWQAHAAGPFTARKVEGDHFTLVRPAGIHALAAAINAAIAEAGC